MNQIMNQAINQVISKGLNHIAAITKDRDVVCWGDNSLGQCNTPNNLEKPTNNMLKEHNFSVNLRK